MQPSPLTEEQITVAARWWADKLRDYVIFDNGVLAHSLMGTLHQQQVISEEADAFERELAAILRANDADGYAPVRANGYGVVQTDYDPDRTLSLALERAGVSGSSMLLLPWKTWLKFMDGRVIVKAGYGQPHVDLLAGDTEEAA